MHQGTAAGLRERIPGFHAYNRFIGLELIRKRQHGFESGIGAAAFD
ncbi:MULTISPECIES: hypothetical protein [Thiorhodovibrio]|nr:MULTISPECIES: hypothetical protein [Thiorhodovibrio]